MFRPIVLMYHGFGVRSDAEDPFHLFVPAEDLEAHLRRLLRWMRPLDLDGYMAGLGRDRWPARSFLLTMDDGYVSTLEVAAPILSRLGVPAVAFVCPDVLGGTSSWMPETPDEPMLRPDQLPELQDHGIEIGAHGLDHTRVVGLTREELNRQVSGSRQRLAELTGTAPRAFAYPEGLLDEGAVTAVRAAGYEVAFSVLEERGRWGVPRRGINRRDSGLTFTAKLLPGYLGAERLSRGHPRVRRLAARLAGQRPPRPG